MRRIFPTSLALAVILSTFTSLIAAERPNVVVIMTDNHGAWTLGCYGNEEIRTPNIDRMASEGVLFERAFACNPVCSPTRATFLTGLIPSQHGVHCFLRGGRLQTGPDARCTLDEFTSLPEVLKSAGYHCGLVGKWHLGDNMHPQEGFDDYWITMPHGGTSTFYDAQIIEDGKLRKEPTYLTDFWTDHALKFIDQESKTDEPFFLFLSYNGPYALSRLLLQEGRNRHVEHYRDQELKSFPHEPAHPWQYNNLDFHNNPISNRRVATEVSGVDAGVGRVLASLKEHGIDDNTIVLFLADQGWVGGHGGFYGMGDHTRPVTARDGMMRIPLIWRQPGKIAEGIRRDDMVASYDVMPTLLSHLGLENQLPSAPKSPGRDLSKLLTDPKHQDLEQPPIFYEFESLRCIRTEDFKYVHRHPNGPHELYDLAADPDEFNNLVNNAIYSEKRDSLKQQLNDFFAKHAQPKYDMWQGGGSQAAVFVGIDEEIAQVQPKSEPPVEESFRPQELHVPEGFSVELAAAPPLVEHPTFATFDDRGRLFVSENAGVNLSAQELEEQLPNSVRLLEDTDGDGRFDKSSVFADKMTFPMGGAWHNGALYVASPPYIWRLEDTDDDGVADKRDKIVSKFGYTGNAASIHGCFSGPDGRIYWCDGFHGHEFEDEAGNVTSKRVGSYIFSCLPDGSDVRLHCGGGMDNPVEVDFTTEGELLGTVNILYTRPRVDCLVHWLYGGAYPHREKVLSELKVTGDFLGSAYRFGHVAVSGTARYKSGVMDHRWKDHQFVTFFNSGKVVRVETKRSGATYTAEQREFLSCDDREFHPTDVTEAPDGSLLVVDTGGWFYRGCPTSQYAKPDIKGAIYRIRRDGMTTLPDPTGSLIDWPKLSVAELIVLFNDPRQFVRERAIDECSKRGDTAIPLLKQAVERRDVPYRRNALWALTRIVGHGQSNLDAARSAIRIALSDARDDVQQIACRSLSTYPDPLALKPLLQLFKTGSSPVRREAATALGRLGDALAVPTLLGAAARPGIDRAEEHAIIYAMIEIDSVDSTRYGLTYRSPQSRYAALVALDQMDSGNLKETDVIDLLREADPAVLNHALDIYIRRPDWNAGVITALEQALKHPESVNEIRLSRLLGMHLNRADVQDLVGPHLARSETRNHLLVTISQAKGLPLHDSWRGPLQELLSSDDDSILQPTLDALVAIDTDQLNESIKKIADSEDRSVLIRIAASQALSGSRSLGEPEIKLLMEALTSGAASERLQAAQKLAGSPLKTEHLKQITALLPKVSSSQLQELIRPYQRTSDTEICASFLTALEGSREFVALQPFEFSDVIKRFPQDLLPRANELLDRLEAVQQEKIQRLDNLLPLLESANAERGRELFFAEKTRCATCHRVGEQGKEIGPNLTTIGANRAARDLLESIVFPSSTIVRDYEPYTIETTSGRIYSGIVQEQPDRIVIQQQVGDAVSLSKDEIETMVPSPTSIMPNGLEKALSEQELADVVAYLLSLKR